MTEDLFYTSCPGRSSVGNFNGNILARLWKNAVNPTLRGIVYAYDPLYRMTNSTYGEGTEIWANVNRYDEHLDYDKNGNYKQIVRNGQLTKDPNKRIYSIFSPKYMEHTPKVNVLQTGFRYPFFFRIPTISLP